WGGEGSCEWGWCAQVGCRDSELGIDDRRVVAEEELVAGRRAALGDLLDALSDDPLRQVAGIGDRRRRHDELRRRAVMAAEAAQKAHAGGNGAAEDAPKGREAVEGHRN